MSLSKYQPVKRKSKLRVNVEKKPFKFSQLLNILSYLFEFSTGEVSWISIYKKPSAKN